MVTQIPASGVLYPESDGKPMADNTQQYLWIVLIKEGLELQFADRQDVFVAADLLWYPVEGNNCLSTAPDVMVAIGRSRQAIAARICSGKKAIFRRKWCLRFDRSATARPISTKN